MPDGTFVAHPLFDSGLYYSNDGIAWAKCDSGNDFVDGIWRVRDFWIAQGFETWRSVDGITWVRNGFSVYSEEAYDCYYRVNDACGMIIMVSEYDTGYIACSVDGVTWTSTEIYDSYLAPNGYESWEYLGVKNANGMWVLSIANNGLLYSPSWEQT